MHSCVIKWLQCVLVYVFRLIAPLHMQWALVHSHFCNFSFLHSEKNTYFNFMNLLLNLAKSVSFKFEGGLCCTTPSSISPKHFQYLNTFKQQ